MINENERNRYDMNRVVHVHVDDVTNGGYNKVKMKEEKTVMKKATESRDQHTTSKREACQTILGDSRKIRNEPVLRSQR